MKEKRLTFKGKLVNSYKKKKEETESRGYLNLPKGMTTLNLPEFERIITLDFLPYMVTSKNHPDRDTESGAALEGTLWYRLPLKVHRNVGVNNRSIVCPTTFGKKCPICEYRVKRIKDGADKEEFKLFYPQLRSLYPIIPINVKDFPEKIYIWDMADSLFQEILMEELEMDAEKENFFTLDNGETMKLRLRWKEFSSKGRKSVFPEVLGISFLEREPYSESILEKIPKLDDIVKILSYDEISALFFEADEAVEEVEETEEAEETTHRTYREKYSQEEEEDEEDKIPQRTHSTRTTSKSEISVPSRRKPVKEEDEEEEEVPQYPRSKGKPVKEDDEEEDDTPKVKTVKTTVKETTKNTKKPLVECSYGHVFGVDTDEFDDCENCKIWEDCIDEKDKNS